MCSIRLQRMTTWNPAKACAELLETKLFPFGTPHGDSSLQELPLSSVWLAMQDSLRDWQANGTKDFHAPSAVWRSQKGLKGHSVVGIATTKSPTNRQFSWRWV